MESLIKNHCKKFKEKFECNHSLGFITSKKSDVKAGMKINLRNGGFDYSKIRNVGKKTVYILNKVYNDGDVQIYGMFTNLEQAKSVNR